jgi:CubicO group peptidase (beta-lactamase class C family)
MIMDQKKVFSSMKISHFLLAALCFFVSGILQAVGQESPVYPSGLENAAKFKERVDLWLEPLVSAGHLSGTLLVASGGEVVYEESFGMADYELGAPNTPDTLFCIASLTKPITVITAAHFIEKGALSLDTAIDHWFPDFPRGGEITVEHLLRHRSGIPHRVTTPLEETVPRTAADMVEFAKRAELLFEPGSQERYSSAGYSVLARILEIVGGKSYNDLIREIVFEPAGAKHSIHTDSIHLLPGRACSYYLGPDGPINAPLKDYSFLVGAGSIFSTPQDLLAVINTLRRGDYGKLVLANYPPDKKMSWNGITNGFRAFADHYPEQGLTVIFTGNIYSGATDLVRKGIPRLASGEELEPAVPPEVKGITLTQTQFRKLEGYYEINSSPVELRFIGEEGRMAFLGSYLLFPLGEDLFYSPQDYTKVRVIFGEDGSVKALKWGETDDGPRFPYLGPLVKE